MAGAYGLLLEKGIENHEFNKSKVWDTNEVNLKI